MYSASPKSAPSPSTSFGTSETPPSKKALKKQMKLLKLQKQMEEENQNQTQQAEDVVPETAPTIQPIIHTIPDEIVHSPPDTQPQLESKRKKQTMKRIVGFDPVLIAQALEDKPIVPIKKEPPGPPKPAWSMESKQASSQPVSLIK